MRFQPKMRVETPDGEGVVKFSKNKAPDFTEVESVICEVAGKECSFSPDSVKLLDEQPPATQREPKKAKTVSLKVPFQNADGSLLPKSDFLALMGTEYDRLKDEMFGGNYEDVEKAVGAVFDLNKGASVNYGFVESRVVALILGGSPSTEEWRKLSKRLKTYLTANTGEHGAGKTYGMRKGSNGGTFRHADQKTA